MLKLLLFALLIPSFCFAEISAELVLEWLDNGIITALETEDLLKLIEEENEEEACAYAFAVGIYQCKKKEKTKKEFSGFLKYTDLRDSSGDVVSKKASAKIKYKAYSTFGNSDGEFLLAYQKKNLETLFGYLNNSDIHFSIPQKKYLGSFYAFQGCDFSAGFLLSVDSMQAFLFSYRYFYGSVYFVSGETNYALEIKNKTSAFALWWNKEMSAPLWRASLVFKESGFFDFSFRSLFYGHQDTQIPYPLKLPTSVSMHKIWGSMTQTLSKKNYGVAFTEKILVPYDSSETKIYLGVLLQKQKGFWGWNFGLAFREISSSWQKPQIRAETFLNFESISVYVKSRMQSDSLKNLFHEPRLILGVKSENYKNVYFKTEIVYPENAPSRTRPYQFIEEAGLKMKALRISLKYIFRYYEKFSPYRFSLNFKYLF